MVTKLDEQPGAASQLKRKDTWDTAPIEMRLTRWIASMQAIAQTGLTFTQGPFDKERYVALLEIAAQIATQASALEFPKVQSLFQSEKGYATPKIDVRGAVFQDNKILMVKERSDGLWTLPGGWADVNHSPAESMQKEIDEEAGFKVKVIKLIALYDKLKHAHPPQWPHTYKCFFWCEIEAGEAKGGLETSDVAFFAEEHLPPLSEHRVTKAQIQRCFEHMRHPNWPTDFD